MASILLAAVAGSPSSQHLPGREPPCYLEDVKARGKFSLGECKKLFLNFTTADDVQKLGNMVGDDGMKAVLTAAQKARALKRFEAQYDSGLGDATCDALVDLIRAKAPPPALVALDLRGNVALESCSEAVAKALLDTRKSRKPAVEELWFPINDQQEGSGAVDLVQQLEYAEVMGHDEL